MKTKALSFRVDLSLLSFNWFLAVFVDIFPVEVSLSLFYDNNFISNKINNFNSILFILRISIFLHTKNCNSDYVHTMPPHFENGEKCDGSKSLASVHTMMEQFENGRKFDGNKGVARF